MKNLLLLALLSCGGLSRAFGYDFVVAKDGSGRFRTVQEAFNAVPDFRKKVTTIFVKKGIYKEKLLLAGPKQLMKLMGEDKGTPGSASCYIEGVGPALAALRQNRVPRLRAGRPHRAHRLGQLAESRKRKNGLLCGVPLHWPRRQSGGPGGLGAAAHGQRSQEVHAQGCFCAQRALGTRQVARQLG